MSSTEHIDRVNDNARHRIIFADRESVTPTEDDLHIKQLWIDVYNENVNTGAVQPDGTIAWDCPCLGTQAIGPCSTQFRAAFTCYQHSTKEPKGRWTLHQFTTHFCSLVYSYENFEYVKFSGGCFRL